MSALGGSMFPRFLMSERHAEGRTPDVQRVGARWLSESFWRQAPLWQLWPQVLVLVGLTLLFLVGSPAFLRDAGKRR